MNQNFYQYGDKEKIKQWLKDEFNIDYKILKAKEIKKMSRRVSLRPEVISKIEKSYKNLFELFKENEGTRLKLTHKRIDTLPDGIDFFSSDMFDAGWIIFFTKLVEYL